MQVHHDFEAWLAVRKVDPAKVDHHLHVAARIVAEKTRDLEPRARLDDRGLVAVLARCLDDVGAERFLQDVEQLLTHAGALLFWPSWTSAWAGSWRGFTIPGVRSPRAILSWRSMSPSKTASGRGGQPGM